MKNWKLIIVRVVLAFLILPLTIGAAVAGVISSAAAKAAKRAAIVAATGAATKAAAESASRVQINNESAGSDEIEITQIRYFATTNGFKNGVTHNLSGYVISSGGLRLNHKSTVSSKPGVRQNRFGRTWIAVSWQIKGKVGDEFFQNKLVQLYDERSQELTWVIDMDDGAISEYRNIQPRTKLKLSELHKISDVQKHSKEGLLISRGSLFWQVKKLNNGIEFCWIEKDISRGKADEETSTADCDLFDDNMKPISNRILSRVNGEIVFSASGTFEIR